MFHPFSRLPAELRLQIWEMTVEPRTVEVRVRFSQILPLPGAIGKKQKRVRTIAIPYSPTPVPGTLQTCREARNHGLYQQAFSDLVVGKSALNPEPRYLWLNLDIDIISIDETRLECFESVASSIIRLKLARDDGCESWSRFESDLMRWFVNVEEIYVDIGYHKFQYWCGASEQYYWPCGAENVYMITAKDSQMMNLAALENKYDRIWEEELEKEHGFFIPVKNGNPQWPEDIP